MKKLSLGLLSSALFLTTSVSPVLAENWTLTGSNIYNNNSGNVGIGTAGPGGKIDVRDSSARQLLLTGSSSGGYSFLNSPSTAHLVGNAYWDQTSWNRFDTGYGAALIGAAKGYMTFNTAPAGANPAPWTERMRIDASGNVGIGTASPATKFHYVANTADQTFLTAPRIQAQAVTGENFNMVNLTLYTNNAGFNVSSGLAFAMLNSSFVMKEYARIRSVIVDETSGSEDGIIDFSVRQNGVLNQVATINNAGNVGIGWYLSPAQKLDVDGRIRIRNWTADGTTAVYKNASGDLGLQSSDLRLKKNITPITDSLTKIAGINGVLFNWKTESDDAKKTVGVIAQDVIKVLPEATYAFKNDKGEELYGVHYEKLTALLVQGVKDQQKQIDELRKEIEELKKSR